MKNDKAYKDYKGEKEQTFTGTLEVVTPARAGRARFSGWRGYYKLGDQTVYSGRQEARRRSMRWWARRSK